MRKTLAKTAAAGAATTLPAMSLVAVDAAPTVASAVWVRPASVQGACDVDAVPVVVASGVAAQSDIYSAVTSAGALGDACIVLASSRGEAMPAYRQLRLDAAASVGHVLGGLAAVPDSENPDRAMARLGGDTYRLDRDQDGWGCSAEQTNGKGTRPARTE